MKNELCHGFYDTAHFHICTKRRKFNHLLYFTTMYVQNIENENSTTQYVNIMIY